MKKLIRIICCGAAFVAALVCYLTLEDKMPRWGWLIVFLAVYVATAYDVLWHAVKHIVHGKVFDENFLMVIATIGAFCILEFAEAVAVMLFYQIGEYFQDYAVDRSKDSIAALMDICPETVTVVTPDGEAVVPPDSVEVGSVIAVRAGERIAIDGVVVDGSGYVDCSALTGESVPVSVGPGSDVLAGSISTTGLLRIRTEKRYADSAVAKILDMVENASAKKARTENFITRFAAIYTPAVVISALLVAVLPPLIIDRGASAVWFDWIRRALTFLVVSCPCALVISVPLSFFGGIGAASRRGILVKGGNYLELLGKADTVVFDKTGTVTKGVFEVTAVHGDRERVLTAAAAAEQCSNHPVASAIVAAAVAEYGFDKTGHPVSAADEIAGRGIAVTVPQGRTLCGNALLLSDNGIAAPDIADARGTLVHVACGGEYLGAIEVADAIKPDSAAAIAELKASGIAPVMLTGDRKAAAETVAAEAGIPTVHAELLPGDKVERVEELITGADKKHGAVVFVGDGINDAPVLSRADVGIAMGAFGSDAAIEASDIVLMHDSLRGIATARRIAKKTRAIVTENIVFALAIKLAVLILAGFGIVNMWLAVFADVGVALIATLNAVRALFAERPKKATDAPKTAQNAVI